MKDFLVFVLTVLIALPQSVLAAEGDFDSTFGAAGKVTTDLSYRDYAYDLAIQADGKLVAAGRVGAESGVLSPAPIDFGLARYKTDGSLDTTFGVGGKVSTDFEEGYDGILALAIQADGKILAAGHAQPAAFAQPAFGLARYTNDGSLDTTFGSGGKVITDFSNFLDWASAVAIQPDGRIIAAGPIGWDFDIPGSGDFALVRYYSDGSLDTAFGSGGKVITDFFNRTDWPNALAIQPDGRILVAGFTADSDDYDSTDFALTRYNSDGSPDTTFGVFGKVTTDFSGLHDVASALGLQPDGKIVVIGNANYDPLRLPSGDLALARYNNDGSLDETFGAGGKVALTFFGFSEHGTDVFVQSNGTIVVGGNGVLRQTTRTFVARFSPSGEIDRTFGTAGVITLSAGLVLALKIDADGKIVTAGSSSAEFGLPDFEIVRLTSGKNLPGTIQVRFDPAIVAVGDSWTATFSGIGLTDQTYFDVRFYRPDSNTDHVALNWQRGTSASHHVALGTSIGAWIVTGVRPHQDVNDHGGEFLLLRCN